MSAPTVDDLIGRLVELSRLIEECEGELYRLRAEQQRLRAELGAPGTGQKPGERQDDLPL